MNRFMLASIIDGVSMPGINRVIPIRDSSGRPSKAIDLGAGAKFEFHRERPPVVHGDTVTEAGLLTFTVGSGTTEERRKQLFIRTKPDAPIDPAIIAMIEDADIKTLEGGCELLAAGDHALVRWPIGGAVRCIDRVSGKDFVLTREDLAASEITQVTA